MHQGHEGEEGFPVIVTVAGKETVERFCITPVKFSGTLMSTLKEKDFGFRRLHGYVFSVASCTHRYNE